MKHSPYKQSIWGAAVFAMAILFLPIHHQAADFAEGGKIPLSSEEIEALLVPAPAWAGEFAEELGEEEIRQEIAIGDIRYPVESDGPQKSGWTGTKWTNETVYYQFNANVNATNKARFVAATAEWSAVADLTFLEGTGSGNYIHVQDDSVNSSSVGMIGGQQTLKMVSWSSKFIICHELAHALGQKHEQSRSDRDTFVTINTANIEAGKSHNFNIFSTTNYGAYDFTSVMHYRGTAFGINGAITIQTKPGYTQFQSSMGQRTYLSALDQSGMASRYGAPPGTVDLTSSGTSTLTPATVQRGEDVTLTHRVSNVGTGPSGSFVIKYYLSSNQIISTGDVYVGEKTDSGLSGGFGRNWTDRNYTVPSSLTPGTYYLGWIIDANNDEGETDENNNTSYHPTPITVTVSPDDNYEENDTYTTAYDLSTRELTWLDTIDGFGKQRDEDWYKINVTSGYNRVLIDCRFTDADGDIDISLYASNGTTSLDSSSGTSDNEYIDFEVDPAGGTFYIKVHYGNVGNSYNLWWDDVQPPYVDLNDTSESFTSTGGGHSIGVTSNASWTWSDNASWVTSSESSPQTGNQTFSYSVATNTSANARSATITFVSGSDSETHTINQSGSGPPVPSGLSVTQQTGFSIDLAWGSSANATGYEVWRGTADNPGLMVKIANTQGRSYSDYSVDTGDRFYYAVRAVGANGSSGYSGTGQGILYGRPDSMVKAKRLLGNNRYITYGGQTAVHKTKRAGTSKFELWLQNDSYNWSETFKTRSGRGNSKFKVVYLSLSGQGNVTSAITRGVLYTQIYGGTAVRIQVKVKPTSRQRKKKGKITLAASTSFLNYQAAYDRGKMVLNKAK